MQGRIVRGSGGNGIKRRLESDVLANWRRSSGDEGSQIPITKIGEDNLACVCARRLCRSGRRPMRSPLYCDAALEVVGGKNACLNRSVKRRSLHLDRIHFFSCTMDRFKGARVEFREDRGSLAGWSWRSGAYWSAICYDR